MGLRRLTKALLEIASLPFPSGPLPPSHSTSLHFRGGERWGQTGGEPNLNVGRCILASGSEELFGCSAKDAVCWKGARWTMEQPA